MILDNENENLKVHYKELVKWFDNLWKKPQTHKNRTIILKEAKPVNLFVTPKHIGNFDSFEELFNHFPPKLSAYQPFFYLNSVTEKRKNVLRRAKSIY